MIDPKTQTATPSPEFTVLGEALALMAQSDLYGGRSLEAFSQLILPPLALGQLRIWRSGGLPVGMATWAYLDAETEQAVVDGDQPLSPEAWNCGRLPVVMDFVAPFGNGFKMARDLTRTIFPGVAFRAARRSSDGRLTKIVQFPGQDAHGNWASSSATAA
ncbi:toxin-activating lysine-acyltransferase [Tropicimonas sp. TH_r6]|uniref:toxin-activating lysine-acyltransferase n=1 Tax=Tropicimonas sp. TH_r6 TaxID=3082085 RepID=UPI0029554597|nr:toxin-activating lysine-acyltransferase [Tropicimonas sp. TH_r6]MDV7142566.1 toxin-activating lysine-acyltransferase [Tropicimonas sp. TH_r6]